MNFGRMYGATVGPTERLSLPPIRPLSSDRISLILVIVGAVNWGAIGLFQFDIVSWLFGGQDATWSRIIYTLVGLCGLWCITLLFRKREVIADEN